MTDKDKKRAADREAQQRYVAACRAEGRCTHCVNPAVPGKSRCVACYAKNAELMRKIRNARVSKNLCITCGKPVGRAATGKRRCPVCAALHAEQSLAAYHARRDAKGSR